MWRDGVAVFAADITDGHRPVGFADQVVSVVDVVLVVGKFRQLLQLAQLRQQEGSDTFIYSCRPFDCRLNQSSYQLCQCRRGYCALPCTASDSYGGNLSPLPTGEDWGEALHIDIEGQTLLPLEVHAHTKRELRGTEVRQHVVGSCNTLT